MLPPDSRDPNSAAPLWPGETLISQRPFESPSPTLPRTPPAQHDAPQQGVPQMPRYAPPSDPMGGMPLQPIQPVQPLGQGYAGAGSQQQRQQQPRAANAGGTVGAVDFAAVPTGAWLAGAGGLAMLLGSFLPWISVATTGANNRVVTHSQSGWDLSAFGRVTALIGLLTVVLFVVRLLKVNLPFRLPWSDRNIYMTLGIEALLLGVLYLIDNAHNAVSVKGLTVGAGFGLYLTVIGAVALVVGAYLLGRPLPGRPLPGRPQAAARIPQGQP